MYFLTTTKTYEILEVRSEVIIENWSNATWEGRKKSVINVMAMYWEWEVTGGQR
jgi:hypothetical protein